MNKHNTPFHSISTVLALAAALLAAPEVLAKDKPATAAPATAAPATAAPAATEAVQEAKSPDVPAAVAQKSEATPADDPAAEAYRKRLLELRGPRDKGMAQIQTATGKIEARKKAIQAEDEKAGELAAAIEALSKALSEKETALEKIYDDDDGLKALNQELAAAHESFRQSQRNVRDEIARRHREHARQIEKQQREAEAAKAKAEEAAAAKAEVGAKPEAAK